MLLSKNKIKENIKQGHIIISPFQEDNLGNCSYDVSLGQYYYREKQPQAGYTIYNPYNEDDVYRVWGRNYCVAEPFQNWLYTNGHHKPLSIGICPNDLVIWLAPGET